MYIKHKKQTEIYNCKSEDFCYEEKFIAPVVSRKYHSYKNSNFNIYVNL